MKWFFKWAFRIVVLCIVLVVLLLVFKDSILRMVAEHQIRAETGMDVKIGRFSSGLFSPVITIENLKLYNTPEFGGTEFLIIPELHVEFDADALAQQKVRIKLMRFNLSELDVVKNQAGQTNLVTMLAKMPKGKIAPHGVHVGGKKFEFESIDVLNLSLGRTRFIDLKNHNNDREVAINMDNQVFNNVKTEGDVYGIMLLIWLRSGGASFIKPGDIANDFLNRKPHGIHKQIERPASPAKTN
ncbi:MAG TPA: hypothetical protein VH597_03785 [Verrucomicrobiae bacterium]|jgi:hypothetical protein|nr:hypothetical protein [Verrucomicrobiae bacterium]